MRVYVDPDLCISCGDCIEICPEIFDWDAEGLSEAKVDEVPPHLEEAAREALEACPTEAIKEGSPDVETSEEQEANLTMLQEGRA